MDNRIAKLFIYFVATSVVVTLSLLVPPLFGGSWMPDSISKEARDIDLLFVGMLVLYVAILSIVTGLVVYCVRHFAVAPGDDRDGIPLHGHHKIEVAWTIIPAIIVTVISIFSYLVLVKQEEVPAAEKAQSALYVEVRGFQFAWTFSYLPFDTVAASDTKDTGVDADRKISSDEQKREWKDADYIVKGATNLVLPVDEFAFFDLYAPQDDVLHSFWVPESRLKMDVVPGVHTWTQWTPSKRTEHQVQVVCAELCGSGHNAMRADACVVSRAKFDEWVEGEGRASCNDLMGEGA